MSHNNSLTRLIVIDDNQEFLDQLQCQGLSRYFNADLIPIKKDEAIGSQGLNLVVQRVRRFAPDHLVLDVNLRAPGDSQELLSALGEQNALPDSCRIWLISQASQQEILDILERFQTVDARVEGNILSKPILPKRLWAELTDQSLYESPPQWRDFPLPFRVLSPKGKVLHYNRHWKRPDFPDPGLFLEAKTNVEPREFTGSYFGEGKSGFTVHTFALEQEGQTLLGQVAEVHPLEPVVTNLEQTLKRIFQTMELAGYRGRFYRVRPLAEHKDMEEYDRVLELESLSYPPPQDIFLPYRLPLRGWLKKRINDYQFPPRKPLDFRIRTEEDEDPRDPFLIELKRRLGLENLESSLEIPIWVKQRDSAQEQSEETDSLPDEIAGWLIFDRHLPLGKAPGGAVESMVTEQTVQPVVPLLGSLVALLAAAIRRERLQDLAEYEARMHRLDLKLSDKKASETQRFESLLGTLCLLTGAKTGVLRVKHDFEESLRVAAMEVPEQLDFLRKIIIPLRAEYHPIVKAWRQYKTYACQDFSSGEAKQELIEAIQAGQAPYLRGLGQDALQEYVRWVDQDIKALMAIPILLPPNHRIGAITLQFPSPFSITKSHKGKVDMVLQRARWLIQQYQDDKERRYMWHQTLSHELKSSLSTAAHELKEMARGRVGLAQCTEYKQAYVYVQTALDLAENWMDCYGKKNVVALVNQSFLPSDSIQEYLELSRYRIEQDLIELQTKPAWDDNVWQQPLQGEASIFGRVVRVLLDNAFKHGREYLGITSTKAMPVSLWCDIADGRWILGISNLGHMGEDAYRRRFQPGLVPESSGPRGTHIGLYVARYWASSFGGDLSVENLPGNLVQAQLCWPLADAIPNADKNRGKDPCPLTL